jgi:hypothetical protein
MAASEVGWAIQLPSVLARRWVNRWLARERCAVFAWRSARRRFVVLEGVDRRPSFNRFWVGVAALSAGRRVSVLGWSRGVIPRQALGLTLSSRPDFGQGAYRRLL